MPSDLLFECLSEEIPPKMQINAISHINLYIKDKFKKNNIEFSSAKVFISSNRISLIINDIKAKEIQSVTKVKGPNINSDTKDIENFLKKVKKNLNELSIHKIGNEKFYFSELVNNNSVNIEDSICIILESMMKNFPWEKKMKWGDKKEYWVRPIVNILCIIDNNPLHIKFAELISNNKTIGNKFLSDNKFFTINSINDYYTNLKKKYVMLNQDKRLKFILDQIHELTFSKKLTCEKNDKLINELNGSIEYPIVIMGKVNQKFINLPKEVILCVMHNHQRYLAVFNNNKITHFITIASIVNKNIIHGHEKVLNARLTDADFLINQDKKFSMDHYKQCLSNILFHTKLGTLIDKVNRMAILAKYISIWIPRSSLMKVERASLLSKADLSTLIVKEFPELQGLMGKYYAEYFGEPEEICNAIAEHYKPENSEEKCPFSPISVAVAIADKTDNLVGLILANEKSSGSRDPFALKRTATSLIRIIIENELNIPIKLLLEKSISLYINYFNKNLKNSQKNLMETVFNFCLSRFKMILKEKMINYSIINAIIEQNQIHDLLVETQKALIIDKYIKNKEGIEILKAYKRINNIITKDKIIINNKKSIYQRYIINKKYFIEEYELSLYYDIKSYKKKIKTFLKVNDFKNSLSSLYFFSNTVNNFMDKVKVCDVKNANLYKNRFFAIFNALQVFNLLIDFSKIENA
ncbi:glycine--tRNA ligase subunit beta [Neoehrlichia mikurensis]|nr:glycine--tRNA ligase subunit beta [Neoehrlichia mikurensis]QXK92383.1 glycine--tRNA ligase subunit beta [Neoehrlichia mikurensis]QXK93230.1 glycine--tRNA ligase subunit beta [Neoehrlichia mikurensis]QXK94075.1 glycine--tRNA ligase subunit beta [Neoehrlichia mikurensis]UTO55815.1 glycine--tRNA ligase subunit beta [Neoehrlichia mikurensis]